MDDFDAQLESEVDGYEGMHADLVDDIPSSYRLLIGLLEDEELPDEYRPMVLAGIAYFILPLDVIPEKIYGPRGYLDDLYLVARIADEIGEDLGQDLIERNWDGGWDVLELFDEALSRADELLEGEGSVEAIETYVGWDALLHGTHTASAMSGVGGPD